MSSTDATYDEKALLSRISRGDEAAFSRIYERYADQVYSVALMYTKDDSQAQDTVQAVFLKVWEERPRLEAVEHFSGWLFIMARNLILGHLRRNAVSDHYIQYFKSTVAIPEQHPQELEMLRKEQWALVEKALAGLPPQQRTAILLQRTEGLSYAQIAERMGISVNTVRVHLYKGMETLRARLAGDGNSRMIFFLFFF